MRMRLSETEHEIMNFFWAAETEYDFASLMKYFNEQGGKNWKKQTLNTFLSRLLDKGLLKRRMEGRKAYYRYRLDQKQYEQEKAKEVLENGYDGKISHFIAALTGNDSISDADEQELMEYIQKM